MAVDPMQDEPTIGKLVVDAQRDISQLISDEIKLAKSEIKVSVKAGGIGIGLFAAAGFVAVLGIIMLSVTVAYFIHWDGSGLDLHWAYLIVTVFWFLVAGICAFLGIRSVKRVHGPERAIAQAKQNSQAFKRS